MLAANHWSNFDPWPLGIPLFPRRFLRFMAKKELFWPPLGWIVAAGGGFRVDRGMRDQQAIDTAVELCRAGHAVVMFPEGTRRSKGLVKRYEARWHTGAARIALAAGRAARAGRDRRHRPPRAARAPAGRLRRADRGGRPCRLDETEAAEIATDRLRHAITELEQLRRLDATRGDDMSAPLLVVDGDSFAHRAFHALPRSIRRANGRPGNLLTGLTSMMLRLWQAERPRAVFVGWDTLTVPTYRHEALAGYQAGRVFDPELLEQLDLAPGLLEAAGLACAKGDGFEADDFLAAAVAAERASGGTSLVATSDRDAFQLVADDVTILQPVRGVSELARIGIAEVRERYDVEPEQVPDFIALRGDPSDKIPGARGVGAKTAASLLKEHGTLETLLEAGRFSAEADALRLYRHIATLDPSAPVPPLPDREPDWTAGARAADELGLGRLARRLEEAASS